jgi:hypothetical protein
MRLKDYVAKHPPSRGGARCSICSLPKNQRAEVVAALACGTQIIIVWRWLRYDQQVNVSRATVRRHARNCMKIRGRH